MGRIRCYRNNHFLNTTVMIKNEIGSHAGKIWQLLLKRGSMTIRQLGELSGLKESMIHLALGWLARENKIKFVDKNNTLHFEINNSISEIYYS